MRKLLIGFLLLTSLPALADTYQLSFGWTDPTSYIPSDAPIYEARYRVAGGAEVVMPALATPGGATTVIANPGETIDVAGRNCNLGLCSAWSVWVTATAQHPPTQPQAPTNLTITVVRTGT